jgi:hypothetical protein
MGSRGSLMEVVAGIFNIFFLNNYFSKNFVVGVLGLGMKSNEVG